MYRVFHKTVSALFFLLFCQLVPTLTSIFLAISESISKFLFLSHAMHQIFLTVLWDRWDTLNVEGLITLDLRVLLEAGLVPV